MIEWLCRQQPPFAVLLCFVLFCCWYWHSSRLDRPCTPLWDLKGVCWCWISLDPVASRRLAGLEVGNWKLEMCGMESVGEVNENE